MPLPLPKNCRLNKKARGIDFEVAIKGRNWKAFITFEAVDYLYPCSKNRVGAVSRSSYITRKVAERIRVDDVEPIHVSSVMVQQESAGTMRSATRVKAKG
jgi:hypothetical protein